MESPRSIMFNLRKGVKYHNGEQHTAEDMAWAFSPERLTVKGGTGCPIPESMTGHPLAAGLVQQRPKSRMETIRVIHNGFIQSLPLDRGGSHPVVLFGGRLP